MRQFWVPARKKLDRQLLFSVLALLAWGAVIFFSASLGLLPKGVSVFTSAATSQFVLGFGVGLAALFVSSRISYRFWRQVAPALFVFALFLTAAVFIPGLGVQAGGATRWIQVGGISFQPAELLKVAAVLFAAAHFSRHHRRLKDWRYGLAFVFALVGISAAILLLQPDTGTLVILGAAVVGMYFIVGARYRDLAIIVLAGVVGLAVLALARPYVLERFTTFLDPFADRQASGYQITQALIAIGSGGLTGRGFGQSVQKFQYLPEPTSDSIFAVYAEEFGFVGGVVLIALYMWFWGRSLFLAARAPDYFGSLLLFGLSLLIVLQAFFNMYALMGLAPLSGLPLPFVSQGGSAIAVMLFSVGIMLSASRYVKKRDDR